MIEVSLVPLSCVLLCMGEALGVYHDSVWCKMPRCSITSAKWADIFVALAGSVVFGCAVLHCVVWVRKWLSILSR